MSRRNRLDAVIVGGGVVGAACALALSEIGLQTALIEAQAPPPWRADRPDLRVYAFAPDNAALLGDLGVWRAVAAARLQPYRRMRVWDAAGGGELRFDADAFGRRELGWIVEHGLLVDKLWAGLSATDVRVQCPARVDALEQLDDGVRLRLDDGSRIEAGLAIAADGAESSVRALAGLQVDAHSYAQRGVVAYVQTERPHEQTAWQRFLPTGPLAFLPCADGSSSIVWTLPEGEAARIASLDDDSFDRELTAAFDGRLGRTHAISKRVAFPLRRQLARDYAIGRVALIGDAAHVVHPLAGQGVNLGLRDVAALRDAIVRARARKADYASPQSLSRWARERKSENAAAAHAFSGINRLFSNDSVAATLMRGPLLGLAGRLPPVTQALWRRAAGLRT
ncbi:UbiH/UbiF family hydroxylase [Luteimonas sp. SX5]|uniref:UbiH/UbiF family hydroxylase n=1 Tax=Luteimonas galliterrae TaxID=2940486 RepID=A0ABT0MHW0_9GAMM|nr:UbiH/UbiF family hydroxylase [Luteimonas galliterrae]MCL1634452.1 UbiH/UbiF family hydroxylase [Luteimonas galliterrae]